MNDTHIQRLGEILDREVLGQYDLRWYVAEDLVRQVVLPDHEFEFSGLAERDLVVATQAWMDRLSIKQYEGRG